MAIQQSVGALVGFSATPTVLFTSTGFTALTYLPVGFVSSIPDLDGTYDIATFDDLGTGLEHKFADMMRAGEGTFTVGYDTSDTGQAAIETAKGTKGAFKFTLKSGVKYHRNAIVKSFKPTGITVGSVVTAEIELAFEGKAIKVAA